MTAKIGHPGNSGTGSSSAWLESAIQLVHKGQRQPSGFYPSVARVFSSVDIVEGLRHCERLHKLKALRRWVTICAWCKEIRDSEGVWQQPQANFRPHEGGKFSHGICPRCAEQAYAAYRYENLMRTSELKRP